MKKIWWNKKKVLIFISFKEHYRRYMLYISM